MTTFGIASKPDQKDAFIRWVTEAEQAGFGLVCTGDSPALLRDQYVALTLLALNTSRCKNRQLHHQPGVPPPHHHRGRQQHA